jgi:hypothetical protein
MNLHRTHQQWNLLATHLMRMGNAIAFVIIPDVVLVSPPPLPPPEESRLNTVSAEPSLS